MDGIITDLLLNNKATQDVTIGEKRYYNDPSGTTWVEFVASPIRKGTAEGGYGIIKKVPGGSWELVNYGTGAVECGLPEDVQVGLGFDYCPHG